MGAIVAPRVFWDPARSTARFRNWDRSLAQRRKLLLLLVIGILPAMLNGLYTLLLAAQPPLYWFVDVVSFVVVPAVLVGIAIRERLVTPSELGLHGLVNGRRARLELAILLVGAPIVLPVLVFPITGGIGHRLFPTGGPVVPFSYEWVLPSPDLPGWRALMILYLSVTAGVVEELYFRALLYRLLSPSHGWLTYVSLSAGLFGAVHWEAGMAMVMSVALYGIVLAALFRATRNLWPLMLAHAATDIVVLSVG